MVGTNMPNALKSLLADIQHADPALHLWSQLKINGLVRCECLYYDGIFEWTDYHDGTYSLIYNWLVTTEDNIEQRKRTVMKRRPIKPVELMRRLGKFIPIVDIGPG